MANKTITYKEFYEAVIKANLSTEITDKAKEALAKLNTKSASKDKAKTENAKANLAEFAKFAEVMKSNTTYSVAEVKALTKSELHPSKISAIFRDAEKAGLVTSIEGYKAGGKGRPSKGYTLVTPEAETETESEGEGE